MYMSYKRSIPKQIIDLKSKRKRMEEGKIVGVIFSLSVFKSICCCLIKNTTLFVVKKSMARCKEGSLTFKQKLQRCVSVILRELFRIHFVSLWSSL